MDEKWWIRSTLGEVAEFFGVSRDTVRKEWASRGMPGGSGRYDVQEIMRWKISRERDKDRRQDSSSKLSPSDRLKIRQSRLVKLRTEVLKSKVMETDEVLRQWNEGVLAVRSRLEQIPDEFALEIREDDRPRLVAGLKNLITLALRELTRWKLPGAVESTDVDSDIADTPD